MRKCYINIGMHKTGSSSIQSTWFHNKALIEERFGLHYFSAFINHGQLSPIFYENPELFPTYYRENIPKAECESEKKSLKSLLESEIEASAPKPFVLTAEDFSLLTHNQVAQLKEILTPYFETISIIIYVREPFGFLSSMGQQTVKTGARFSDILHDTFYDDKIGASEYPLFSSVLPNYRFRIEKYQKIFGKENVLIRKFDRSEFPENDVVHDYAQLVFPELNIMDEIESVKVNEALSHEAVLLLEAINRRYPLENGRQNPLRAKNLVQILKNYTPSKKCKFEFSEMDMKKYAEFIYDDVQWLSETTQGEISFDLSSPPVFEKRQVNQIQLDTIAQVVNDLALKDYNSAFLRNFFILMNTYHKDGFFDSSGFKTILNKCDLEPDLIRMSNVLSQSKRHLEALQFAEKVIRLYPENQRMEKKVKRLRAMGFHI